MIYATCCLKFHTYRAVSVNLRLPAQVPLLPYEPCSGKSATGDLHKRGSGYGAGMERGMQRNGHQSESLHESELECKLQDLTFGCLTIIVRESVTVSTNVQKLFSITSISGEILDIG